jgi:hypothetical protein
MSIHDPLRLKLFLPLFERGHDVGVINVALLGGQRFVSVMNYLLRNAVSCSALF